jgi:hypothetical protein
MSLTVGANSWVTLSEANSYFDGSFLAYDGWNALTDSVKERLLISAYRWINQQSILSIPAASTSQKVKDAQCEAAWYLYSYGDEGAKRESLIAQGVTEFKLVDWQEKLAAYNFPESIKDLLGDFYVGKGGYKVTFEREY